MPAKSAALPLAGWKLVVADDEPDQVTFLASVFEDHGATVLPATNGQELGIAAKELHESGSVLQLKVGSSTGMNSLVAKDNVEFIDEDVSEKTGLKIETPWDKAGADVLLIHNAGEIMAWPMNPGAFGVIFEVAGATSNDLAPVARQGVHGPAAHVSGQHYRYSHAGQLRDDARLASAAGQRSQRLLRLCLLRLRAVKNAVAAANPSSESQNPDLLAGRFFGLRCGSQRALLTAWQAGGSCRSRLPSAAQNLRIRVSESTWHKGRHRCG